MRLHGTQQIAFANGSARCPTDVDLPFAAFNRDGTEILHVSQAGNNLYRGKAFDPESNMHIPATVRFVDAGTIEIQGCALFGLICKTQRWTKVD